MARTVKKVMRGYLFDNNNKDTGSYFDFEYKSEEKFPTQNDINVLVSYQTFLELGLLMWRNGCWAGCWRDNDGFRMRFYYVTKDKKRMTYESFMPSHDLGPACEGKDGQVGMKESEASYEI